ncbi:MAG: ferredoxin [Gammaproteobacteria bacterium]|mgnify:CR=1 FL=1|jgi:ferredoxin|nr:ferredoxin [Gammaproteobacteria bacterium]MBT4494695.1 ferredoxin [Gammaproteobacteria bacterium]MBT7372303.1 ferredoxin [Gammaproteobacteria bacterium]
MKVKIDTDKCIMAGECYYNHPELFRMGRDGFPTVLTDDIGDDKGLLKHANEAIEVCPATAISLED